MANLISVSVLKYGNEEFGTTAADAKTMMLSSEHIIYGTNVETALGINATVATAATDALTITAHGLTSGEYIRVGDVGDSVGNFDIASSDYTPGKIFKQKITGADNVFLHGSEAHYDANTKQDITTGATGMTLPVYRVQGKLLYADTMGGGRPIEIRTVEPCVNVAYDADTISENNLMINLDRVIMTYEGNIDGGASADDWATWYDKSNNNCAGIDSAHVDMLQIETSLDSLKTSFLQHMGGLTVSDFATLTVNSRVVAFPDTSLSGLLRLKNIVVGRDSVAGELSADGTALGTAKAQIIMKGTGKHGYDTLALDENITTAVASTMEDHVIS